MHNLLQMRQFMPETGGDDYWKTSFGAVSVWKLLKQTGTRVGLESRF